MFYACGDGKTTFNDIDCMNTPLNMHVICMLHTSAYFIVDTIIILWWEKNLWTEVQMLMHHVLSIFNFYGTLVFMNYTMIFGVLLLFTEVSTLFICMRWFLYTHGYGHSLFAAINSAFIFLAFLTCRLGY